MSSTTSSRQYQAWLNDRYQSKEIIKRYIDWFVIIRPNWEGDLVELRTYINSNGHNFDMTYFESFSNFILDYLYEMSRRDTV